MDDETGTLIVGGGPAGVAPVLAASRVGALDRLLDRGLALVERHATIGEGRLGRYAINSDSSAATFLSPTQEGGPFDDARRSAAATRIAACGAEAVPLPIAGALLGELGRGVRSVLRAHPRGEVLTSARARWTRQTREGDWITRIDSAQGARQIRSRTVVLATGGHQPLARLYREQVGGHALLPRLGGRLLQSDAVLGRSGTAAIARRLSGIARPRVAVIGGSTSAMSVIGVLLRALPADTLEAGAITLLHRGRFNLFYPDAASARADGYDAFTEDDICPVSGFVHRFGGLRFDNRERAMRILGLCGRTPEPRVRLHPLDAASDHHTWQILDRADLVIACLGYRPRALRVLDPDGAPIALMASRDDRAPMVDAGCAVLDASGHTLPGLLGIGLASGFSPRAALGGEPSFHGQFNGLWLWQTAIGEQVARAALARCDAPRPVAAPSGTVGRIRSETHAEALVA